MVLRKHLVKITVVFLSLFALASLLKFFHLTERFATKTQWQKVVIALLKDITKFKYTYGKNTYKINDIKKKAIKKYIKSTGSGGVHFSDFTSYVGETILEGRKEAAKQMIKKYAKEKLGTGGFTGTHNSKRIRWSADGSWELYDNPKKTKKNP